MDGGEQVEDEHERNYLTFSSNINPGTRGNVQAITLSRKRYVKFIVPLQSISGNGDDNLLFLKSALQ